MKILSRVVILTVLALASLAGLCGGDAFPQPGARDRGDFTRPPRVAGPRPAPAYRSWSAGPQSANAPALACDAGWTLKSPAASPWPRRNFAMAYDEARGEAVMYGGWDGYDYTYETWVYDGINWSPKSTNPVPWGPWLPGMTFDRERGQTVLFGGYDAYSYGYMDTTWVWNGDVWAQKSPANKPSPRQIYAMAYDSVRKQVVLFGGSDDYFYYNDTWVWDGVNWTQRFPVSSPSPRTGQRMAFDEANGEMVLFGGYDEGGMNLADTWVWNGTDWTQRFPIASPDARNFHAMSYDSTRGFVLLYGGYDGAVRRDDSWFWDGGNWHPLAPATIPPRRSGHAMAYDAARGETLLYGGWNGVGNYRGDTWGWSFGSAPFITGPSANQCPGTSALLSTQPFLSWQWRLNGTPLSGATGQYFSAVQSGDYSVDVTSGACGAQSSPPHAVAVTDPCPCVAPPKFDGLASVTNAGQSICALTLSWPPATLNCGSSLSYQLYRSTQPGFTPSPANRIASGITATGYTDFAGLTNNLTYHYIVRSLDDLGNQDANRVEKSAAPSGPVATATFTESFEGAQSGGGFDNPGWLHGVISGTTDWVWSVAQSQTPSHSWLSGSQSIAGDRTLSTPPLSLTSGSTLSFWHTYAFEGSPASCYDAGTLEVTTNGGTSWNIVPAGVYTSGGYNGTVNASYGNPLGGKPAWCGGAIGAMTRVDVNLGAFSGQTARLRWHAGDDTSTGLPGWYVDSVTVTGVGSAVTCTCPAPSGLSNNSAADQDACAATGVAVGWLPPVSWGDAGLGTRGWIVLRDGSPVTIGPCSGVFSEAVLNCIDTAGGAGLSHSYSIRAVNGCGTAQTTAGVNSGDALDIPFGTGFWSATAPSVRPPARLNPAIAFDGARNQVVLFGGNSSAGGNLNDTWIWDGTSWAQQFPANSPLPRTKAAIAFDEARGEVILFGGTGSGSTQYLNDTWAWDGTNWTQKSPATSPFGFDGVSAAYDSARGEVVIYGGYYSANGAETWIWNGSNWSKKSPATTPPSRTGTQLVYDPLRSETVMYGGSSDTTYYADTWVWNGNNWQQKFPSNSPSYRAEAATVFDPVQRKALLFGGQFYQPINNHLWAWDGVNWSEQVLTPSPSTRSRAGMAFDRIRGQVTMFGGFAPDANVVSDETWIYSSAVRVEGVSANTCPDETVMLSTQSFSGYQWNRNGTAIPSAVAQSYLAAVSGDYSVTVTSPSGCSVTSAEKSVAVNVPCPCDFAGLASAVSAGQASCAVNLSWLPTTSGCGSGVTYNVYRSIIAGFSPALTNQIATGVTATSFADTASLTHGVKYHYIVRSVTGGGTEDANIVEKFATPAGAASTGNFAETFEGAMSGGGFDNPGWKHQALTGTTDWVWSTSRSNTPTHSWFSAANGNADNVLVSPGFNVNVNSTLTFYHAFNFPNCCGYSYMQISSDGGDTWARVPASVFTEGGYNCTDDWCNGSVGSLTRVVANLGGYAGQTIRLRWRLYSYSGITGEGWYVDSITVSNVNLTTSCTGGCAPPTPAITNPASGCTVGTVPLSTQPFAVYQWFRYGAAIPGATGQNYEATQAGDYAVTATDASGCSAFSPTQLVDIRNCCTPLISNNTAADVNSCASTGVDVGWNLPADWGDGGNSAYRMIAVSRNGVQLNGGGCRYPATSQTTCNDATGTPGTNYVYTVRFLNGCYSSSVTGGAAATDVNNSLPSPWIQLAPATSPGSRAYHAMASDIQRQESVLFGGYNGSSALSDTWIWSGGNWIRRFPAISPSARSGHALVYDAARSQSVLFGGSYSGYYFDTWIWDGTNWVQRSPTANPPSRTGAAIAYDALRNRVVLFGGCGNNYAYLNDTWIWDGINWQQLFPALSPPGRCAAAMTYDAGRGETVLFGGDNGYVQKLADTWVWDGTNWSQKSPSRSPVARSNHAMAYDASVQRVVLFGGYPPFNDTWSWDGANWSQETMSPFLPSSRYASALVYDAASGRLLLMGGYGNSYFSDTWRRSTPVVEPVSLTKPDGAHVRFYWPDLINATAYTIYQDPLSAGPFTSITGTAPSGTPGLTVPMPVGDSLFFKVAAANSCGEGPK